MRRKLVMFMFVLGTLALAAGSAGAFGKKKKSKKAKRGVAKVEHKIKKLDVLGVRGDKLEITLVGKKDSGRDQQKVTFYLVKNGQRTKLKDSRAGFKSGRGMNNTLSVSIRGKDLAGAKLLAVVDTCKGSKNCEKEIPLSGGDLVLEWASNRFERRGSNTIWTAKVVNKGPGKSPRCKLELKIEDRKVKDINIRALDAGKDQAIELRYDNNKRGKKLDAELKCTDFADNNNKKSDRLK